MFPYKLITNTAFTVLTVLTSVWFSHSGSFSKLLLPLQWVSPTKAGLWNTSVLHNILLCDIQFFYYIFTGRHTEHHIRSPKAPMLRSPSAKLRRQLWLTLTPWNKQGGGGGSGYFKSRGGKGDLVEQTHIPVWNPLCGRLKDPGSNVLTAQILLDCFSTRKVGRISNINFDEAVHKLSAIIK